MRHGREALGLTRIVGLVEPDNHASARVLGKLGLRFERALALDAHAVEIHLYA
jgi:RimJ/RimL family protein N-acetyltransferase